MARQRAQVLTHWIGTGTQNDPFRPALADQLQAGESWQDEVGKPVPDIAVNDAILIEVEAEEARIAVLDAAAHRVFWKRYVDSETLTGLDPDTSFTSGQVSALNTWVQAKFGVTTTQIANWFNATPAQLSNWLQTHTKREAAAKLKIAWRNKIWK